MHVSWRVFPYFKITLEGTRIIIVTTKIEIPTQRKYGTNHYKMLQHARIAMQLALSKQGTHSGPCPLGPREIDMAAYASGQNWLLVPPDKTNNRMTDHLITGYRLRRSKPTE